MHYMHYAASHHKLDIGNAFWSVSCNIPDCRAHRVHELLMNNYIDDIPRLWEQRKNKILFMDQVFNTTCINDKVMETDPVKECHDSNGWSNPRACGQQVKQEAKVPAESRSDHKVELRWESVVFKKKEQTCCWNRCPKVPQDFPCRCSSRLALACCAWARQHFLPNLWNIVVRDKKDN